MALTVPEEIEAIGTVLNGAGFEAHLVGGCVRDFLLGREPKDWDIATNALPEDVQKLFPDSVYENKFGTVGIKTGSENPLYAVVEVTTYRTEGTYRDMRHPDSVAFVKTIEEDLARRDFTVNALAFRIHESCILNHESVVDPFGGIADLKKKIIRAVGRSAGTAEPDARFMEDALRLMRAVRFAAQLGFTVEEKTMEAVKRHAGLLEAVAKERVRDELVKIIESDGAGLGIRTLTDTGLMRHVLPELLGGVDCGQNKHHIYTVYEHNVRALEYTAKQGYSFEVRLGSLLHDVGKPATKRGDGHDSTFYNHEVVGAKMACIMLDRLHFPKKTVEKIAHLVRWHLFYYNVGEVTESGVRRFVRKVGPEHIADLLKVREADRIGSGVPKAVPYKLRHLMFMIEKVAKDAIDTRMLALDGTDVMRLGGLTPSPKVGWILAVLLEEVLDDPARNAEDALASRIKELNALTDVELKALAATAKDKKEEFERGAEEEIKEKFHVK
ncbi:MAG: HD domain-containing protein [bacterium]|nr:HD domain-containing protein [bacterium]